ncbi:MAG: TIGR00159 family protein [Chloroflexi bacterium]|nr:TIGR00159 family protein [Chloroflexota bacterium]MBV9543239.1 TIGR00159 family protein [Chloroflexota bacterium]
MDFGAPTERLVALLQLAWSSVAGRFGPSAILDLAIVSLLLYWLLSLISGTSAATLVRGILILLTLGFVLSNVFNLMMLQFLLRNSIPALIFAIPVLFAPEMRRALEQLGRAGSLIPRTTVISPNTRLAETVARAAQQLSERRFGALLVIERSTPLGEYASKGVPMDAVVSAELLLNIFWPNSPLHDGAVILHGDRIVAAAVVLPLAQSPTVEHIGTRHRAAIGITEISDAIAVVVSEETGTISLSNAGRMVRNLGEARLQKVLSILDRAPVGFGPNGRGPSGTRRDGRERQDTARKPQPADAPDADSDAA